MIVKIIALLA